MKKIIALFLSVLAIFSLVACGGETGTPSQSSGENDDTKDAQLVIGVYDGAAGYEFAYKLVDLYKKQNPGVKIAIKHKKDDYDDDKLINKIAYNDEDLYFGSGNNIERFVASKYFEDITDVVTEKVYDDDGNYVKEGGTLSIEDRMWEQWRPFNKVGDKYYTVSNFAPVSGITYDADLFNEKGYTVPQTYAELKTLMNKMVTDNVTPFTFCSNEAYIISSAFAFWANYEGWNDFLLNSTYTGTDTDIGEINYQNAWKLQNQAGKKAYLQFYYDLAKNDAYTTRQTKGNSTNVSAQDEYVSSIAGGTKRVAMLIEHSFWEREAKNTIDGMGEMKAAWGWGKRNFKYMIAPVDTETERKTVYVSYPTSYCFINSNSKRKEIAKDFLKFSLSREALALYTIYTGCLRPYDYTFTTAEYESATPYTQSLIDLTGRDDVDFCTMGPGNSIARLIGNNAGYYAIYWANTSRQSDGTTYSLPFTAFRGGKLSVNDYFDGCIRYMSEEKYTEFYDKIYKK